MKKTFFLLLTSSVLLTFSQLTAFPNGVLFTPWVSSALAWFAIVPMLLVVHDLSFWRTYTASFFCFFIFYTLTLYWLTIAMSFYGGLAWILSILILFLLIGLLAFFMAAGVTIGIHAARVMKIPLVISLPAAWVAMEYARQHCFTGFPWANLADSQSLSNLYLSQIAEVTGENGVTFLLVAVNILLLQLLRKDWRFKSFLFVFLLVSIVHLYGYRRLQEEDALRSQLKRNAVQLKVAALQGNIPQDQKWDREFITHNIVEYVQLTKTAEKNGAQLAVWPEAAYPLMVDRDIRHFPLPMEFQISQIIGVPTKKGQSLLNSAFLVSPSLEVMGSYDKTHLVPFGEYVPLKRLLFFVDKLVPAIGDFQIGQDPKAIGVSLMDQDWKIGIVLCYEDVFPAISRTLAGQGAQILINITNDAWYSTSSAPYQHLSMSVYRAIENRLPLIRSTNTGITASIAPSGRVEQTLPWFQKGIIYVDVPHKTSRPSFYTLHDDWFPKLSLTLTLSLLAALIISFRSIGYTALGLTKGNRM